MNFWRDTPNNLNWPTSIAWSSVIILNEVSLTLTSSSPGFMPNLATKLSGSTYEIMMKVPVGPMHTSNPSDSFSAGAISIILKPAICTGICISPAKSRSSSIFLMWILLGFALSICVASLPESDINFWMSAFNSELTLGFRN